MGFIMRCFGAKMRMDKGLGGHAGMGRNPAACQYQGTLDHEGAMGHAPAPDPGPALDPRPALDKTPARQPAEVGTRARIRVGSASHHRRRTGKRGGRARARVGWSLILLLISALAVAPAQAFVITSAEHRWQGDSALLVRLGVDLDLPEILLEAIANGIAVHLTAEVRLERGRWLGANHLEASATRSFRLFYSALSRNYILTDLDREYVVLAPTLGDALDAAASRLGRVVLEAERLTMHEGAAPRGERRTLSARVQLDYAALPLPLQWDPRMRRTNFTGGGWLRWPLR